MQTSSVQRKAEVSADFTLAHLHAKILGADFGGQRLGVDGVFVFNFDFTRRTVSGPAVDRKRRVGVHFGPGAGLNLMLKHLA